MFWRGPIHEQIAGSETPLRRWSVLFFWNPHRTNSGSCGCCTIEMGAQFLGANLSGSPGFAGRAGHILVCRIRKTTDHP